MSSFDLWLPIKGLSTPVVLAELAEGERVHLAVWAEAPRLDASALFEAAAR